MPVAITVKYLGPTETKGGRWSTKDPNTKTRVVVGFHSADGVLGNYQHGAATMAAAEHARRMGWTGLWMRGALDKGDTYAFVYVPSGNVSMLRGMRDDAFFIERGEDVGGKPETFIAVYAS